MKVLILDNYDSFVYNLAQLVGGLGAETIVARNDSLSLDELRALHPDRIIISPGPGTPEDEGYMGICNNVIKNLASEVPILGVCLGHQAIVHVYGGTIIRAKQLMHGKTSKITHDGKGIFNGVGNPLVATRYHSLVADRKNVPRSLEVTAVSADDEEIMGVRHVEYPVIGVQFHPESILTREGKKMMRNFLRGKWK